MFAHWIWSLLLLAAPVALYVLVIRPKLQARLTDIYAGLDSFWARVWARTYAFRTFWISTLAAVLTALPDILVQIAPLDFSEILPRPWPMYVTAGSTIALALMKAFETKPREEQ